MLALERCARIAAALEISPEESEQILAASSLEKDSWETAVAEHEAPMMAELERGQTQLLDRFDDAYVGRLEEERGGLNATQYAKLVVAAERCTVEEIAAQLEIPFEAIHRIERVMMRRLNCDEALERAVSQAIEVERDS